MHLVKRKTTKRSPSKRLAFKIASKIAGIKIIVYTDPEKISFITHCLPQVVNPLLEDKADIVIPSRNPALFKSTYSAQQYGSEMEGNKLYNEQL